MEGESGNMKDSWSQPHCMAQLHILSGEFEQHFVQSDTFPMTIGRGSDCQLQLTDDGVWEHHLEIDLDEDGRFIVRPAPDAATALNEEPVKEPHPLRNGDTLSLGAVKLQFWLGSVQQTGLRIQESSVWAMLAAVVVAEVVLMLWLT